jgi:hypothetical protein
MNVFVLAMAMLALPAWAQTRLMQEFPAGATALGPEAMKARSRRAPSSRSGRRRPVLETRQQRRGREAGTEVGTGPWGPESAFLRPFTAPL